MYLSSYFVLSLREEASWLLRLYNVVFIKVVYVITKDDTLFLDSTAFHLHKLFSVNARGSGMYFN